MLNKGRTRQGLLLCGAAAVALTTAGMAQAAEAAKFNIPAQPLSTALAQFGVQAEQGVFVDSALIDRKVTKGVTGDKDAEIALNELLVGTGLGWRREGATFVITKVSAGPQSGSAAGDGAEVEALIVTAQKREENIQDVPIAMSAFTQEDLTTHQIAGGPDLMTQIPNFTFTKTNFSGYSIQIRGIGTQAISATVDPAVAVAFNNTPFIRNRFFEQEFYDLQRIEVLRGPQGTLYGRNATAGVVNVITARPKNDFEAKLSADLANYSSTRLEGMINIPLVEDMVSVRLAGAWTKRDGYVTNNITNDQIDGRDLWSVRATLGFEPTDDIRAYLTIEHFEENDDRLRSGKQLCKRNPNLEWLGGEGQGGAFGLSSYTSQGCEMGDLYAAESFQVPNGFALPYFGPLRTIGLPINEHVDPYTSTIQSRDLRVIESTLTPVYKAKTDIIHLAFDVDVTDALTLSSETGYTTDELFSFQDYNRFNTSEGIFNVNAFGVEPWLESGLLSPDGVFCDPQLGCASRLVAADVSTARSDQFSQEFRLSSDFEGPFNFHIGGNYLRYDTVDKYYVFINSLTMFAAPRQSQWEPGVSDGAACVQRLTIDTRPSSGCGYIDQNPISQLDDNGHQYFLSKNPFRLISYAVFGEAVYKITPDLKVTAGLRYTVDQKRAPIIPSRLLTSGYGLPVQRIIEQEWREPTGRLVADWQPDLGFTDETLLYASYAHGYKAGGTNPPLPGGLPLGGLGGEGTILEHISAAQPPEFGPEFIDAYEIGTKNTLLDGRLTLNLNAFYYDYEGYQISQIANRSAVNLNFDAKVWGAELELDWRPLENLKLGFKGGWEKTRMADGSRAIDMIDRSAGDPDWVVIKANPTVPSNCILPRWWLEDMHARNLLLGGGLGLGGNSSGACMMAYYQHVDPGNNRPYEPNPAPTRPELIGYPGFDPLTVPNNGEGIFKDLSGNELPNAPDFTMTFSADYTLPLPNEWLLTLHGDFYRQSEAWARIFNEDPYDRLKPFSQVNLAAIFTNEDAGWKIMAYVKNALDKDNITGAFLNSDDTGLTTNVFLNEPRLYGLRVTKNWGGGDAFSRFAASSGPYPFTIELGAGPLRVDADDEVFRPGWSDEFASPDMPIPFGVQDEDLDWGDSREVKIAYRPPAGPWNAALGVRFGRTNGTSRLEHKESVPGGFTLHPDFVAAYPYVASSHKYLAGSENYVWSEAKGHEEHAIVDFSVGRDLGMGLDSTVSAGIRYANFKSTSAMVMRGTPDITVPPYWLFLAEVEDQVGKYGYAATMHQHSARAESERSFEGVGPVLSWEASRALAGNHDSGQLALDWGLSGGVLFGKQKASVTQEEESEYFRFPWRNRFPLNPTSTVTPPPETFVRNEGVEVPVAGISLGLSYDVGRVKISTGYSYERYFDAIDGGVEEAKQFHRDISGPYLKLRVGFGG